ncbi:MAG: Hsp20/alpha crystallin family protein [Rhodoferax sp.]|uniref:Hsp20/alpha crystallin family protein n=1 Tax=Rhodoferax sp. TaxID=50421 RepID=UPI0026243B62|nr:Hsp20/alpha crystallin family protein [Rhodoferax sp.]MDD2879298.1 Hsp20/alpha crystallin family protein [Rhodoferax sp.]
MRKTDSPAWMLAKAIDLLRSAGGMHQQFFQLGQVDDSPRWEPPVDMFGDERALCLLIALPGVTPERLDVTLEQQTVVVNGVRSLGSTFGADMIIQLEIPYGRFERRVQLPHADYRMVDMLLRDGCLRLTLERMP